MGSCGSSTKSVHVVDVSGPTAEPALSQKEIEVLARKTTQDYGAVIEKENKPIEADRIIKEKEETAENDELEWYKKKYSIWFELFDTADEEKTNHIPIPAMRKILKIMIPKATKKQLSFLLRQMDTDHDRTVGFVEFARYGEALKSGNAKQIPGVDYEEFRTIFEDAETMRSKVYSNLIQGSRDGSLGKLVDGQAEKEAENERIGKEFEEKYPEWKKTFDEARGDAESLSKKKFSVAIKQVSSKANAKTIKILFGSSDENDDGKVDWIEFCHMGEAIVSGDISRFPGVNAAEFKSSLMSGLKKNFAGKLRAGLASGEVDAIVTKMEEAQAQEGLAAPLAKEVAPEEEKPKAEETVAEKPEMLLEDC